MKMVERDMSKQSYCPSCGRPMDRKLNSGAPVCDKCGWWERRIVPSSRSYLCWELGGLQGNDPLARL